MLVSGDLINLKYSLHRNGDFDILFGYRGVTCSLIFKNGTLTVLSAEKKLLCVKCDYNFITGVGLLVKLEDVYVTSEERVINFLLLTSFEDNFIKAMNLGSGCKEIIYPSVTDKNINAVDTVKLFNDIVTSVLHNPRTALYYNAVGENSRVYILGNYRLDNVSNKFILRDNRGNLIAMSVVGGVEFGKGCTEETLVVILRYINQFF